MKKGQRAEAKEKGVSRYSTGIPCAKGHLAERLTVNGSCCECSNELRKARYYENREEDLRRQKIRRDSDPLGASKKKARRHQKDPGLITRAIERDRVEAVRDAAMKKGETTYDIGLPCPRGHISPRSVKTTRCVECNRISCMERHQRKITPEIKLERERKQEEREVRLEAKAISSELWKEASKARNDAIRNGETMYTSKKPCPLGHVGLRRTTTGFCIECERINSSSSEKKDYDKVYGEINKAKILARTKIYNQKTAAERTIKAKEWAKKNPERRNAISKHYKARRRSWTKEGSSFSEVFKWESEQEKVCLWCGTKCEDGYHVDHIYSLSKGGLHHISNLAISCGPCNLRKNAKDPIDFAIELIRTRKNLESIEYYKDLGWLKRSGLDLKLLTTNL